MSNDRFSLAGKVAIVTGGSKGIGKAIALGFAEAGADVVVCARGAATLAETAAELRKLGRRTLEVTCDVSDPAQVQSLMDRTVAEFGRIDILVNNAGINPQLGPLEKTTLEAWNTVINVNLTGSFLCSKAVFSVMRAQKSGVIINMGSILGRRGLAWTGPYGITKAGIDQLTRSAALEWARHGIRVNCMIPGFIDTEMVAHVTNDQQLHNQLTQRTMMKRLGKAEEMVGLALLLASDAGSYITGQSLVADGGWIAH